MELEQRLGYADFFTLYKNVGKFNGLIPLCLFYRVAYLQDTDQKQVIKIMMIYF